MYKPFSVVAKAIATSLLIALMATQASAQPTARIATLDWTIAETLVGLGLTPQAVAQISAYHDWVGEPRLPDSVVDLGLRTQPNLELLAELQPDLILISPMFSNIAPRLANIAPVETLSLYTPGSATWAEMLEMTRKTARLAGRPEAGEALIDTTEAALRELRTQLPKKTKPLLIVQFMDARHVRVFGDNGLYHAALEQLGLQNAWTEQTNSWGFSLVGIEELLGIEGQLVVIDPSPLGVAEELSHSGLWQAMPDVRNDSVLTLPPVWSFGALPSARRFAESLTSALVAAHAQ